MLTTQNMNVMIAMMDWIIRTQKEHKTIYAYGERQIEYMDENGEVINSTQWLNFMIISRCEPCAWLWEYIFEDADGGTDITFYVDDPEDPDIELIGRFCITADNIWYYVEEMNEEEQNN